MTVTVAKDTVVTLVTTPQGRVETRRRAVGV